MPRKASAADCPRMCKIFVKGPAPMVPVGDARTYKQWVEARPILGDESARELNVKQAKSKTCGGCRTEVGDANGNWKGGARDIKPATSWCESPGTRGRGGAHTCSSTSWWQKSSFGGISWRENQSTTSTASEMTTDLRISNCERVHSPQASG
jgi:hypothetical protein